MKQKNPEYELEKIKYESLHSTYEAYLVYYGGTDNRTVKALHEQAVQYWKWKNTPEFIEGNK